MDNFPLPASKEILLVTSSKLNQIPQDLLHAAQSRYSHKLDEPILNVIPVVSRPPIENILCQSAIFGAICAIVATVASPNIDMQTAFYVVWIPSTLCFTIFSRSRVTYGFMAVTETHYNLFELNEKSLDGGMLKESIQRPAKLPEPRTYKGAFVGDGLLPFEQAEKGFWYYSARELGYADVIKRLLEKDTSSLRQKVNCLDRTPDRAVDPAKHFEAVCVGESTKYSR